MPRKYTHRSNEIATSVQTLVNTKKGITNSAMLQSMLLRDTLSESAIRDMILKGIATAVMKRSLVARLKM